MTNAVVTCHKPLGEQAQKVLRWMIERGGITRREAMDLGVLNLPARVLDIRTAYGPESVVTEMWPPDGETTYAVYRFRGFGPAQLSFFASESRDATATPHAGTSDPYETEEAK